MNVRRYRRAVALVLALSWCVIRLSFAKLRGPLTPMRRALWLQTSCRHVLASLGIHYRMEGTLPERGLVVANHLSYLDVALMGAVMRCVFVSKVEVNRWPFFGMAARAAGTLFIDRSKRASAEATAREIAGRLDRLIPILIFPEGTSSDGSSVLRFHSTLFEPAVAASAPITAAAVRYVPGDGIPERELCWFGDEGFLSHMWKVLATPHFSAEVIFSEPHVYPDRRTAAQSTHEEVEAMRHSAQYVQHAEEIRAT